MKNTLLILTAASLIACKSNTSAVAPTVASTVQEIVDSGNVQQATLSGIWFSKNGDTWEGLQLEADGRLLFPNTYSMVGDNWEKQGDTLVLFSHTERYPEKEGSKYLVKILATDRLVLNLIGATETVDEEYEKITVNAATDQLLGRWTGPEGTMLDLLPSKDGKAYTINIMNMKGSVQTYEGKPAGDLVTFVRNGTPATLRASDGKATGMKWLADKTRCITISEGEGYCRY